MENVEKINIGLLASELAYSSMIREMLENGQINDKDEATVYDDITECYYYTEQAQEIYNKHYDEFYDIILNCKV